MPNQKKIEAFTLIEILVALTIVGVLLTFVAPNILNRPDQARHLKVKNDFLAISTALSLHRLDTGAFPSPELGLAALVSNTQSQSSYLSSVPKDPWHREYRLVHEPNSDAYRIVSSGPNQMFEKPFSGDDIMSERIE